MNRPNSCNCAACKGTGLTVYVHQCSKTCATIKSDPLPCVQCRRRGECQDPAHKNGAFSYRYPRPQGIIYIYPLGSFAKADCYPVTIPIDPCGCDLCRLFNPESQRP